MVSSLKTLTLYSRPQCHLCELLLDELRPLLNEGTAVEIIDISEDPDLTRRYGLRIPILSCNGEEISGYPLQTERVKSIIATQVG